MVLLMTAVTLFGYGSLSVFENPALAVSLCLIAVIYFWKAQQKTAVALAGCFLIILSLSQWTPLGRFWPLPSILPAVITATFLYFRHIRGWLGKMGLRPRFILFASVISLISFLGVFIWIHLSGPDLAEIPFKFPFHGAPLTAFLLILIFSVFNSFAEEFYFRGLTLEILNSERPWLANLVQAAGFGLLHFKGFPFGVSGSFLAFLFALQMGLLRQQSGGILYAWLSHFLVNVMMGSLLLYLS